MQNDNMIEPALQEPAINQVPEEQRSFGTFKPVGHVLIGVPAEVSAGPLASSLSAEGLHEAGLVWITPVESIDELQRMIDEASPLAGFGYEITMMRRFVKASASGHRYLLVKMRDDEDAPRIGEVAKAHGASFAVRYGTLVLEDLI